MAANPIEAEEPSQNLNHKTWVLRVSIHCEGCKRKVKKILHSIPGVYSTEIETKQQRVTVTGNVGADTLIRKLIKSGKNAELWPEKSEQKEKSNAKQSEIEKIKDSPAVKVEPPQEKSAKIGEAVEIPAKQKSSVDGGGASAAAADKVSGAGAKIDGDGHVKESKSEGKKPETASASGEESPATVTKGGGEEKDEEDGAEKTGGGGGGHGDGGKKKKKKGQNGNLPDRVESSIGAPRSTGSPNHSRGPPTPSHPVNHSPPRQQGYHYPVHHYAPPPVQAVSYNTAHPSSSYMASYYASPPPYSYAYTYQGPETVPPPPPSDLMSPHPTQPLDSFELFSDENPNGCSIM